MTTDAIVQPSSMLAVWIGRVLSGLLIAFLIFDSVIKLIPIEPVLQTMGNMGYSSSVEFARFLGILTLVCTALYAYPKTSILGAVLMTAMLGGAIASQLRIGALLFSHVLFGVYLGLFAWGGLFLREPRLRALFPLKS